MNPRRFSITRAAVSRPDERSIPEADRIGPHITVGVFSRHLKSAPVDSVVLSDDEALLLATSLLAALAHKKGLRP